jgi:primosomal protein N' (replication factor Y)
MVAKGHDFPDVTLGVVLDADSTLRFPDFRAEERTFALIAQLAGRAGRGPRGGRVLVQTATPDAPSIVAAARHDSDGFLAGELARRKALRYPPFADLVRVVCSAPDAAPARAAAGVPRSERLRGRGPCVTSHGVRRDGPPRRWRRLGCLDGRRAKPQSRARQAVGRTATPQ